MHYIKPVRTHARLMVLSLLSILAACGGKSEQEAACDQAAAGNFPILNGLVCIFGAADDGAVALAESDTGGPADGNVSYGYQNSEYEPNTSLDNSNPLVVDDDAIAITGIVGRNGDTADNFVFTPSQTGDYRFSLCAAACDQAIADDMLILMVLDQSQTTIASTSLGTKGEKSLALRLSAGVAYYTAVSSFGASGDYRLVIAGTADGP